MSVLYITVHFHSTLTRSRFDMHVTFVTERLTLIYQLLYTFPYVL